MIVLVRVGIEKANSLIEPTFTYLLWKATLSKLKIDL